MTNGQLVLDVFDGGRLLTRAFEHCGFCVVGGPELIFGQDLTGWRPPPGRFDGIIGGPPCQKFSRATQISGGTKAIDMIPDFCAIVASGRPAWFVMENVEDAYEPRVEGYLTVSYLLNRLSLGVAKQRRRRFTFGVRMAGAHDPDDDLILRLWERAMSEVLPRREWPRRWVPSHPLDPPAADCGPQVALTASDKGRGEADASPTHPRRRGREGLTGWYRSSLQPALLATDGKSHLRSANSEREASGVTGWHGKAITVDMAWAAQELPGEPPELWTSGAEHFKKAGAIRMLGNGVPFDMGCHVARAVSVAVLGIDTGSVVRWPERSLLGVGDAA